ncbi:MAG: glycosyltransferase [Alphaproteobacteria bacterium]|nr:glycosyltransferase [Alphaproteobacteria bacterium]
MSSATGRFALGSDDQAAHVVRAAREAIVVAPEGFAIWHDLALALWADGHHRDAWRALRRAEAAGYPREAKAPPRSIVIPVLDYSPDSPFDIVGLLADLEDFAGEVICVFNSAEMFADLREHPRIDKFSFNKHNVGVARSWNIGLNQAEGEIVFILNADLHLSLPALGSLERHLLSLPNALAVGLSGDIYDFERLKARIKYPPGSLSAPVVVDKPSGFAFALHARRLHDAGICFDPRLSPYFYEELDLTLKARQVGLEIYAAPVSGIEHVDGISSNRRPINCLGREVDRMQVLVRNANLILDRVERSTKQVPE